ncbi:hypothetical protein OFB47_28140, partial [Escherichia coli]|nr:hypothetical protein [Escherichia coli]
HVEHLLIYLLHGHPSTEDSRNREVPAVAWVTGGHHVLGVEDLLGEFRHSEGPVLLASTAGERGKARHEEVQAREGHHIYSQFPQVSI